DWCMVVGQIAQAAILGAANIGGAWLGRCPPCPQAPGCPAPALSCPPVSLTCPAPPAPPALTCPQVTCAAPACPPCEAPAREEVAPCPSPAREDAGADGRLAACLPLKAVVLIGADSMLAVVSSSDLVPGDVILVRYAADDLWHERVLSWALPVDKSGAVHWVVATPDGDMYVETIEGGSADDSPVEWIRPAADGRLPVGFQDAVYSFQRGEIDGALLEKCVKKGATMALMDAREHGVTPVTMTVARAPGGRRVPIEEVVGAGFVQPALRDGAPDGADAGGAMVAGTATPRTGVWRVVEEGNSLGYDVGREVKPVTVYIGCKGVYSPDGKDSVFVEFSDEDEGDFVKRVAPRPPPKESSAQDARTLAIKFNPQGRMRDWRDVVDSCQQEEFEDFPVSGPRSMSWCLHFLRRRHTPLDHHLMFRSTCSLKPEQWGVAEHETLLRIIELAGQCDQLDVTNLACMEAAARRVQTIEWAYHDKIRETDAGSTSRLSIEEATAFSGLSRAGDLMMVLPALLEHVKLQVEKDAAIMKNIRKAKEERELRRQAVASLANQAIYTLNDLAGSERGSSVSQPGEGRAPHGAVQRRVYAAAAAMGPPPALSPSGALQELRGCTVYEDVQSTVVPYDDMKASLPMSGNRPVPLAELFGAGGQAEVDGFLGSHLLKSEAASHNLKGAPRETYMDEVLRNSPRAYQRLVKRLERARMIDYTVQPQEFCSLFFVRKKNGSQRLVVDCRRSNCWFSAADPVQLSTGAGHGNLEVPDGARLCVGHVDIKDAFYHFELPERVRNLFALPAVPAWVAGLAEVGGVRVSPGTSVYPRLRVLPMGWSHALWVCQTLHRRIIQDIPGLEPTSFLHDRGPAPATTPACHTVYVDNFLALGTCRSTVERLVRQVSARDIEKVVGHCTFLALLSRTSLSIFRSVYTFIARHRDHGTAPLWESVRWELEAFRNVIPLIRRDFGAPWSSKVMASDASFWGYGVVSRDLPPDIVQQLGRVSERWRFSGKAQVRSREGVLGPDWELDTGDWVKKVEEDSQEREDALSDLPEILKERGWAVLMGKKWEVPISNIVQGEVGPRPPALTYPAQGSPVLVRRRPRASSPPSAETIGLSPNMLPWRPLGRVIGRLGAGTAGQFPRDLSDWMNEQYMEGYDHWRGSNMMAAVAWADPRPSRGGGHGLPLSRQALKGWRLLAPASSRLPLPVKVVFAILMQLLVLDDWDMAVCTSKTGEIDESLLLNLEEDQWLVPLCQRLVLGRDPQELLFAFSQAEFTRCFETAGAKRLLQRPLPPYIPRHVGAGRDFAEQRRALVGAKRQGRWHTVAGVGHYELKGRVGNESAKLPLRIQNQVRWCHKYLPAALSGSLQPRGCQAPGDQVFAGTARLGRAMAAQGFHVLAWDVKYGDQFDLTSPSKRSLIRGWILGSEQCMAGLLPGALAGLASLIWLSRCPSVPACPPCPQCPACPGAPANPPSPLAAGGLGVWGWVLVAGCFFVTGLALGTWLTPTRLVAEAVVPANEIYVAQERANGRPAVPPPGGALKLLAEILAEGQAADDSDRRPAPFRSFWRRARGDGRTRDILPVPLEALAAEKDANSVPLSRSVLRRVQRRAHLRSGAAETIAALNHFYCGVSEPREDRAPRLAAAQAESVFWARVAWSQVGPPPPDVEPSGAMGRPRVYAAFFRRAEAAGLVERRRSAGAEAGAFLVWKKSRRQRATIDARVANCVFDQPDSVELAAGQVAFYAMLLPRDLRAHFDLAPARAGTVNVTCVNGEAVCAQDRIAPVLRVLPMGWKRALWACQALREACARCADSFIALSQGAEGVKDRVLSATQALQDAGLPAHPPSWGAGGEALGRRFSELEAAVEELLSALSANYARVEAFGERPGHLWDSARHELRLAAALVPLARRQLGACWGPRATAFDASARGRGVVQKRVPEEWLAKASAFNERRRFARSEEGAVAARGDLDVPDLAPEAGRCAALRPPADLLGAMLPRPLGFAKTVLGRVTKPLSQTALPKVSLLSRPTSPIARAQVSASGRVMRRLGPSAGPSVPRRSRRGAGAGAAPRPPGATRNRPLGRGRGLAELEPDALGLRKRRKLERYGSQRTGADAPMSFLERRTARPRTEANYRNRVAAPERWARASRAPLEPVAAVDAAAAAWKNEQFFEGAGLGSGSYLLAALGYLRPELTRGGPSGCPSWLNALAFEGKLQMASAAMVAVVFILRPRRCASESRTWRPRPERAGQQGVSSKTGACEESLVLDIPEFAWLGNAFARFRGAARLNQRARWSSDASARRRVRRGMANQVLASLGAAVRRRGADCEARLGRLLSKRSPPLLPPIDIRRHLSRDLAVRKGRWIIGGLIQHGLARAIWPGAPCNAFSRA
ncbi:unnamed protein product, partial [Prorocentrum cordatum]